MAAFGLHALWRAYRACRKGKRTSRDTQAYEANLLDKLVNSRDALAKPLAQGGWRPSRTFSFVVSRPKLREIHAAPFADRVVHHVLVDRLARLFEPVFIHDSYANRLGKGTHAAVDRLQGFMRQASADGSRPAFALQLDIANFFNSIHRPTLFRLLQHRLTRAVRASKLESGEASALQDHCRALLSTDPTVGVRRRGSPKVFEQVPPHKRLGGQGPARGLPIGNLTSQFFANVYLNELDQFIKHQLKAHWYVRYVDDFVLLHPNQAQLLAWRSQIETFLHECLSLKLKALVAPHPLQQGTDFLGYVTRPFYRLARRRVVKRLQTCLRRFEHQHVRGHAMNLPPEAREHLRAQLSSFTGHLRHANSQRLWQRTRLQHPWLGQLFCPGQGIRLGAPRWQPTAVTNLADQHHYFAKLYSGTRVLMQVGRHWMLAGSCPPGMPPGQTVQRPNLGPCTEWPLARLSELRQALKGSGISYQIVSQSGHFKTGFKQRTLTAVWLVPTPDSPQFLIDPQPLRAAT
ncbi:reverse transcriptase domain-containing protein [Rhodoferax sp.]|uniref:reverse transcriptase domain-containing protein n=1 Tax=Rhodoferax sp. TaxID=50421 RepID=UPI0025DB8820|nr:reverse transcriptase domain-containing protein [Rhodoferax sp.]